MHRFFDRIIIHTGGKIARLDEEKLDILIADGFDLIGQSRLGRVDRTDAQKTAFARKRQNVFVDDHFFGMALNASGSISPGARFLRRKA